MPPEDPLKPRSSKPSRRKTKPVKKAHRIMARTHLSHARLMKIIDSYSRWMTVAEGAKASGVSHVTVGRIYNLIRKRLMDADIFESDQRYRNRRYDVDNEGEEGWFFEEEYRATLEKIVGRYRAIDPGNLALYEAEAVFRTTRPFDTPEDVKAYIMAALKAGPLNEKPEQIALWEAYMYEFQRRNIDKHIAMMRKVGFGSIVTDVLERHHERERNAK